MNTSHATPEDPAGPEGSGAGHIPAPSAPTGTSPTEPLPRPAEDQTAGEAPGGRPGNGDGGSPGPRTAPQPGAPAPPQDFFNRIRSHGITRGTNRWVGGVCSGIAERVGIDPVIVRGVLIVLTLFAGIGVLLYGIGWALLPEPDGRIHVQEAGSGHWTSGMTGALIATVMGFSGLGGGFWGGERGFAGFLWACFWLTLVVLVVYLVLDKGRRSQGAGAAAYAVGVPDGTGYGTPGYSAVPAEAASYSGPYAAPYAAPGSAPYQGPYGDGPYGSGAGGTPPRPASNRPRPAGPGTPVVAITAGLALLLGGGLKLLDSASMINLGESPDAVVWAGAAAVLGLGIVFAGTRGKTSGILGFLAVVSLLVGAAFNIGNNSTRFDFTTVSWNPVSVQDATNGLDVTGAHGTADLTTLDLDTPLADDVVVPLNVTASNLTVVIPDNVPVEISADMTMGNISERGSDRGGISTRESSYNTELPGAALVVTIDGTFSNVTIREGN